MPLRPSGLPKRLLTACLLVFSLLLPACGTLPGSTAFYGFGFDVVSDTPGIVVLNYQYTRGDRVISGVPRVRLNDQSFKGTYQESTFGQLPVGDKLYVKWKELSTGVVREVTVDLANRLPSSMEDKKLYFVIGTDTVNVYVAGTKDIRPNDCAQLRKERELSPQNPDSVVRGTFCSRQLDKIFPESQNLNNYKQR